MGPKMMNGPPFQWQQARSGEDSGERAASRKRLAGSILFQDDEGDGVLALVAD